MEGNTLPVAPKPEASKVVLSIGVDAQSKKVALTFEGDGEKPFKVRLFLDPHEAASVASTLVKAVTEIRGAAPPTPESRIVFPSNVRTSPVVTDLRAMRRR